MHRPSLLFTARHRSFVVGAIFAFAAVSYARAQSPTANLAALTSDSTRIVGGVDVADGNYPFVVSLYGRDGEFWCGASLVAPTLVVTAAHCLAAIDEGGSAVVARTDLGDLTRGSVHSFTRIFKHPKYGKPERYANDLAFIELATPVLGVEPIDITPKQPLNALKGLPVTVAGWGALRESGHSPTRMQEVEVDVLTSAQCREAYGSKYDPASMFCAARQAKDSCQGDSGGPIFIKPLDGASPIQVGVVSWGYGCARPESPGVYTRLDSKKVWKGLGNSPDAQRIRSLLGL